MATPENSGTTNPDAITGAPGTHPVATGIGAAAAGAAGAAIGSIVPGVGTLIGGVVGAIAGSVGGGYAGKAVGEAIDPTDTDEYWREMHHSRPYAQGNNYAQLQPAYHAGAALAETHAADTTEFDETRARTAWEATPQSKSMSFEDAKGPMADEFGRRLQLREEQLRVSKDRVSTGDVGIRKEVTSSVKTIEVPVEREEVVITRHAASGVTADAGTIGEEEIRIPLSEERVSVAKDTVVTGEVEIAKRKVQSKQVVSETLRKEDVKLDNQSSARVDDQT